MNRFLSRLKEIVLGHKDPCKVSYAQCGEDLILDHLFTWLKIDRPSYLDIGAHHPAFLSNTYFFYLKGCRGVCVEPDPALFHEIARRRPGDTCINVGVGVSQLETVPFYLMSASYLNTFSESEALRYQGYGTVRIEKVIEMPLVNVNRIIDENFAECPNLVSIDVEGMDLDIVRSFNFGSRRPEVFCIETITYTQDHSEAKVKEIIAQMQEKDYFVYADTYINTIFVDRHAWSRRS